MVSSKPGPNVHIYLISERTSPPFCVRSVLQRVLSYWESSARTIIPYLRIIRELAIQSSYTVPISNYRIHRCLLRYPLLYHKGHGCKQAVG